MFYVIWPPAGSTPFFSGGRHSAMPDLAEADIPIGSPTTVSRKLLQPVLLDTIRTLRTRSVLGLGATSAAANPGMTPGPAFQTPAPAPAAGAPSHAAQVEAERNPGKAAGLFGSVAAETGISKQEALPEQDRYGVEPFCIVTLCACQSQAVACVNHSSTAYLNIKCGTQDLGRAVSQRFTLVLH